MSQLLELSPYGPRDEARLFAELQALTAHHRAGCPSYERIVAGARHPTRIDELPFLHVGVFKHLDLRTSAPGIQHQRVLTSSTTTSGVPSRIVLDAQSSKLQADSTRAIFRDFLGPEPRPLLVLDSKTSLLRRGELSARVAAAMSLRPLASEISFLLTVPDDPRSVDWSEVVRLARSNPRLLVYGFTWIAWQAWASAEIPADARDALSRVRVDFVHSGGWKRLATQAVEPALFHDRLIRTAGAGSSVLDFYGLVEQVGIVYPMCTAGARHVPVWADVIVRDPYTLGPLENETGQLQLLNVLARGAPYHSVLSEDLGRLLPGPCPCGRMGPRFELSGRIPKAELRGCANV